jgi:hypothetical protein
MELSRVQLFPILIGAAVWAIALLIVWLRPERDIGSLRERDFWHWKAVHQRPDATFAEFLGAEDVPNNYLSRGSWTVVISALALLALYSALRDWSAIP